MKSIVSTLLSIDNVASPFGCRLKPALRTAVEADHRFPAHAASPRPLEGHMQGKLPENVVRLPANLPVNQRSSA
ncbi:hypothetical protein SAMN05444358_10273 [Ruegeria halocynthiae]|uniref:Uncharacterized protein n=1 Tax=Ruegeria halocynthiae TaxID=985054 RepID=A0A1H2XXA5_9RHOB|nr:hypothetical protein SAMN05444358_10273 [Ruegeria halocynthiae]